MGKLAGGSRGEGENGRREGGRGEGGEGDGRVYGAVGVWNKKAERRWLNVL